MDGVFKMVNYTKKWNFLTLMQAWNFMTIAVVEIQKMNHHPEWFNVYNKLVIDLMTHDVGGISQNDVNLAKYLDKIPVIPSL